MNNYNIFDLKSITNRDIFGAGLLPKMITKYGKRNKMIISNIIVPTTINSWTKNFFITFNLFQHNITC